MLIVMTICCRIPCDVAGEVEMDTADQSHTQRPQTEVGQIPRLSVPRTGYSAIVDWKSG
jgi:hypothetical protein